MYFGKKPYDLRTYIENDGDGSNMYRGESFGQPYTLAPGDVLANGLELAEEWFDAGNGGVGLRFTDGSERIIAARIPLLLKGGAVGKLPSELTVGDIFETGCVVLTQPQVLPANDSNYEPGDSEVEIKITGGHSGHTFGVPEDLVIALHSEKYPPSPGTILGAYVIKNTIRMSPAARNELPALGRIMLED